MEKRKVPSVKSALCDKLPLSKSGFGKNRLGKGVLNQAVFSTALLVLPAFALSAQAAVIEVTTTEDQNGEDTSNCSLREAVHAALSKEAYGGCVAGQKYFTDVIKLKEGTYTLNKEIEIIKRVEKFGRGVRIDGADTIDYLKRDAITGNMGQRSLPKSVITAPNGTRAFNTLQDGIGLTLNNIRITQAGSASNQTLRGGAFLVGGSLSLNNVLISHAQAKENGGAIFLEGTNSSLSASGLLIQNSQAAQGAAISQFCSDNLAYDKRSITLKNASIVQNKATGSGANIIYACGAQQMTLTNVTMAENSSAGAALGMSDMQVFQKGSTSVAPKVTLTNVTMVNNDNGLSYTDAGRILINDSVIAFNKNKDCQYIKGKKDIQDQSVISMSDTLLTGDSLRPTSNACQLKQLQETKTVTDANGTQTQTTVPKADTSNTYVNAASGYASYFEAGLKDYGLGLLGYLPKATATALQLAGDKNKCQGTDKRGVSRVQFSGLASAKRFSCFKGSINLSQLFAKDDLGKVNTSYEQMVTRYEDRIKAEPAASLTKEQLAIFNDVTKQNQAMLEQFKAAFKDANNKDLIRVAVVDVLSNDFMLEQANTNGSHFLKFPLLREKGKLQDAGNYSFSAASVGTAPDKFIGTSGTPTLDIDAGSADNLVCQWQAASGNLIAYRKDAGVTPAGKFDWCRYTITHAATGQTSSAYVQLKFSNIAPVAEAISLDTSGNEPTVNIKITDAVNDNGDGPNRDGANNLFVSEDTGRPVYIEITKQPELGKLEFSSKDVVQCPIPDQVQVGGAKCYSGDITYVRHNTLSEFGDTFAYKVYDCGAKRTIVNINVYGDKNNPTKVTSVKQVPRCDAKSALSSTAATVTINANRKHTHKTSVFNGGGSFGGVMFLLLALMGIFTRLTLKCKRIRV